MTKTINDVHYKETKQTGIRQSFTCQWEVFLHQIFALYGILYKFIIL